MMYIVAIFIPPLYFLIRGKWVRAILSAIFCATAIVLIPLFGIGIFMLILASIHAIWHLRKEEMVEQAELIAKKMVEAQNKATAEKK
ncbi:MAG: hypothetical protein ACTFAK_10420 [Candidatus Electronema sp. VV]